MSRNANPSAVLVHQASPGGIGQVELLLDRAFSALGGQTLTLRRTTPVSKSTQAVAVRIPKSQFGIQVVSAVARRQPDLVVLTHLNFAFLSVLIRAVSPRSRIVCMAYGIEAWTPLLPSARIGISAMDAIWCISDFTRGMLSRESDIPMRKLHVLPLALSDDRAALIEAHGWLDRSKPRSEFELLSVTRLHPSERYKGVEHVLLSLAEVKSVNANFSYRLVGDGADRAALQGLAVKLGIGEVVNSVGALDDNGLAQALNDCDVFVLPSAKEGFGLAHLEAMCAGKPVIASHAGATPEVVDEASGILTRYADVEGIANAILLLMKDAELRASLGAHAKVRFRERFTEVHFRDRLQSLLRLL
jgi:phosphatidylinositol alpha-1,6-mannosyltransferase